MVAPIRWGIAGCGWVARDYAAPAIELSSNGALAAAYDKAVDRAVRLCQAYAGAQACSDLANFFARIDAVYIATPNDMHRRLVEAASEAGVAVLCEKPMATTIEDAHAMVAACRHFRVTYATAFDQRFHPAHLHLSALMREGVLGKVFAIRIVYCCWVAADFAPDNWRINPRRAGGGALIDLAPHGLDLATVLLGEQLTDIAAVGHSHVQDYAVEDGAMLIARSSSGVLVQLHVAYNCPETLPRRRLEVLGTSGQITATDTMGQSPGGTLVLTHADGRSDVLAVPGADRSPFLNQIEAFAASLAGGEPFAFSADHDLQVMSLTMQAQDQLRRGLAHAA